MDHFQLQLERERLIGLLNGLGVRASPTQGADVKLLFASPIINAAFVSKALTALGISVPQLDEANAIQINCPDSVVEFARLEQSLRSILAPEAILFDMDGVLVDEAPSYREAIRRTCESFGEVVSLDEIGRLKLSGDANNDWEFTMRLLRERGVSCEFNDVQARFESIYQGNDDLPGLWTRERILVDIAWLESLAVRYPLAIVTGRPRNDALRFLRTWRIEHDFGAIVCLEDGPAKPNPANVNTALQKLGVTSGWMIGDTPDDIGAARSAGLVAIGIVAPQDDPAFATAKLENAAAVVILDELKELDRYLPRASA